MQLEKHTYKVIPDLIVTDDCCDVTLYSSELLMSGLFKYNTEQEAEDKCLEMEEKTGKKFTTLISLY